MDFQESLTHQPGFDLFSIFTGESIKATRPAILNASTHALYQTRSIVMVSDEVVEEALASDATSKRIMSKGLAPAAGDIVGIRLNLNLIKSKGVPVQTVHAGNRSDGYTRNKGLYNGSAIAYHKVVTLRNASFNVTQKAGRTWHPALSASFPLLRLMELSWTPYRISRDWKSALILNG
jgi:hypothetical protein